MVCSISSLSQPTYQHSLRVINMGDWERDTCLASTVRGSSFAGILTFRHLILPIHMLIPSSEATRLDREEGWRSLLGLVDRTYEQVVLSQNSLNFAV